MEDLIALLGATRNPCQASVILLIRRAGRPRSQAFALRGSQPLDSL